VRAQVDRDLTTVSCFDRLLGLIKNLGRHRGAPREDVSVGAEEVDEHHFLFRVEGGTDPQHLALGGSRVEGHLFGLLSSLETVGVFGGGVEVLVDQLLQILSRALHPALVPPHAPRTRRRSRMRA
jgi:hypothetical protein